MKPTAKDYRDAEKFCDHMASKAEKDPTREYRLLCEVRVSDGSHYRLAARACRAAARAAGKTKKKGSK